MRSSGPSAGSPAHGDRAVFISRVLPVVRTFISLPAGVARMNVWRFSVLSFVGSFPWSLGLAWAGFVLGENWDRIRDWMRPADIPILIVLAALVAWYVYRRVRTVFGRSRADRFRQQGVAFWLCEVRSSCSWRWSSWRWPAWVVGWPPTA